MYIMVQPARETPMRQSITMRFDPEVLKAARRKAVSDNRTLTNYIETLVRRDLLTGGAEATLAVIAPVDIRNSVAVPVRGETTAERKRRDAVFRAVLDASGR
jgi:hypothetical protein